MLLIIDVILFVLNVHHFFFFSNYIHMTHFLVLFSSSIPVTMPSESNGNIYKRTQNLTELN